MLEVKLNKQGKGLQSPPDKKFNFIKIEIEEDKIMETMKGFLNKVSK